MKSSSSLRGQWMYTSSFVAILSLLSVLSPRVVSAQTGAQPPAKQAPTITSQELTKQPSPVNQQTWRKEMVRVPHPKKGCFMSSYPSMEWQEVPCIPASKRPYPPRPQVGGDTPDFEARVQGTISSAAGSFENVAGVTTETGTGGENSYSLQLNTNWFHTTACRGAADPLGCRGWQQFVYANPGPPFLSGAVFISYWLIGWGTTCPDGWI